MKEVGTTVSQGNERHYPDITGTPAKRNSHVPSLLAQKTFCYFFLLAKAKIAFFIHIYWHCIFRAKLALQNHLGYRVLDMLLNRPL